MLLIPPRACRVLDDPRLYTSARGIPHPRCPKHAWHFQTRDNLPRPHPQLGVSDYRVQNLTNSPHCPATAVTAPKSRDPHTHTHDRRYHVWCADGTQASSLYVSVVLFGPSETEELSLFLSFFKPLLSSPKHSGGVFAQNTWCSHVVSDRGQAELWRRNCAFRPFLALETPKAKSTAMSPVRWCVPRGHSLSIECVSTVKHADRAIQLLPYWKSQCQDKEE
ncbi:uncharacterized protein B0I36DRAFT_112873 [Microdochium trichocladiopsis]|uniref:Uncharacterized protein n=1 Tax=Microdochium trichocladiopsis TaxID=1682393 RepID=A0A9P9BQA8_9PEZI|nr:uncharacterized protein B0I36DRAFT_112873 [Microdochium trichocladiopsis]KAH7030680.1 hypothetical protein B0I36DRAFT_112873 [Microdochium trichocladiopsis]